MKALGVFLLLLWWPLCGVAADTQYTVAKVLNGKSLLLSSAETVRLAGIQAPNVAEESVDGNPGRSGEPLGEEAKAALTALTKDKPITLTLNSAQHDRHNRLLGQVYAGDTWLQGALLNQGYAMVYSFADTPPELTRRMLAQERIAREAKRGIWAHPYFRVITPEETSEFINRFKLVEGKVTSVRESRGNIYINFFKEWKGNFALFISRKKAEEFAGIDLKSLENKTIRVRGWIHYHNAPMIDLSHPEEIELE